MNNLIKILLYSLLGLLVVAISIMVYRRSKAEPVNEEPATEISDELFNDSASMALQPMTAEDSMILDLTGEVASQVGMPDQHNTPTAAKTSAEIDYSKPVNSAPASNQMKSPKVQVVSEKSKSSTEVSLPKSNNNNHEAAKSKNVTIVEKTRVPTTSKMDTKSTAKAADQKANSATTSKTSAKGTFYVVAGSYIVPTGADAQVKKLKALGYSTATKKVFGSEEYYRAVAGKYDTRDQASYAVKNLKAKGIEAFVKQ